MIFNTLLFFHIIMGSIALGCSIIAIVTRKGGVRHRRFGRYFFYAMSGIFLTAIPMSVLKSDAFLFTIAVFSYYLAFSGWRYAKRREAIPITDWTASLLMLLISIAMITMGVLHLKSEDAVMLIVFGGIGGLFAVRDTVSYYTGKMSNSTRLIRHVGGMLGGTIATFTAVLVVNVQFQPEFVLWLLPTVIFTPLILYWTYKLRA